MGRGQAIWGSGEPWKNLELSDMLELPLAAVWRLAV